MKKKLYCVLIVTRAGKPEYLFDFGVGKVARFPSRAAAKKQADFLKIGIEEDVQSINIVPFTKLSATGKPHA